MFIFNMLARYIYFKYLSVMAFSIAWNRLSEVMNMIEKK